MPAGNAHRILATLFEAFDPVVGPGILRDPGDAGTIQADKNFQFCELTSGAAGETRTLASPNRPGLHLTLHMKTDGGGDIVITQANGWTPTGALQATFADVGDTLQLLSVPHTAPPGTTGYRWQVDPGNVGAVTTLVSSSPSSSPSSSASSSPSTSPSSSVSSSPSSSVSSSPSSSPSAT